MQNKTKAVLRVILVDDDPSRASTVEIKLRDEYTLEASLPKQKSLNAFFSALDGSGIRVLSMRNKANRLEELFLRLVDKGITA